MSLCDRIKELTNLQKINSALEEIYETFDAEDVVFRENIQPPKMSCALSIERQASMNATVKPVDHVNVEVASVHRLSEIHSLDGHSGCGPNSL